MKAPPPRDKSATPAPPHRQRDDTVARPPRAQSPDPLAAQSTAEILPPLGELRAHQAELELQNLELRQAQVEQNRWLARYVDLYNLAPVGYVTLSDKGVILEANLTLAKLLGVAQETLANQPLSRFILPADHPVFYRIYTPFPDLRTPQVCELRMIRAGAAFFWARLEAIAAPEATGAPVCRAVLSDITEYKQALVVSQCREQSFREIFDATNEAIFLHDAATGRLLDVNAAMLHLYGYDTKAEILAGTVGNLSANEPPYTEEEARRRERLAVEVGPQIFEWLARRKNHERFWVEVSLRSTTVGGQECILAVARDITERKKTEVALRESNEKYRELVENLNDVIFTADIAGTMTYVSPTVERLFGCLPVDFIGQPLVRCVHPDDHARLQQRVAEIINGDHAPSEYRVFTRSGEMRWICASSRPSFTAGKVTGIQGLLTDITERKRVEEELRQGYLRESAINEILRLALNDVALDRLLLKALDSVLALPELALQQQGAVFLVEEEPGVLVLKAQRHLAAPLLPVCTRVPFGKCLCGRAAASGQVEFSDGLDERHEIHYAGISPHGHFCVPMRLAERTIGVLTLYVSAGYVRSIKMEQFLLGVANALAGIIARKQAEAAREKMEYQFRQSQKIDVVGRLAGGVAHDFNNMLQVILGNVNLALEEIPPGSPVRESLEEIRNCARRSADLTRQLLAFARRQTIAPKVLNLNKAVEGLLKMLRRLIGEDITIAWLPAAGLGSIEVDPTQIDQILANLCVNARDAIHQPAPHRQTPPPAGHASKVTIETGNAVFDRNYCADHPGFVPGEYVLLAVSDDGCGMDQETQSHLFEPFFTTKNVGKGTGLGLATIFGIVKQNHGFIHIYSESGNGTTIKIYLPRYGSPTAATLPQCAGEPPRSCGETVLLVEDEAAILAMAQRVLARLGYIVLTASTPGEALRLVASPPREIHLLITDVVMPEMNGRDLANRLLSRSPSLKCLFMSGYTADAVAHHGMLDQGVHFIEKPFSLEELATKVREALGEKAG